MTQTTRWQGGAPAIAGQKYFLPGTVQVGNIFTLTLATGVSVSYKAVRASLSDVVNGLLTTIQASAALEFAASELVPSVVTESLPVVTTTPVISSVTEAGGGVLLNATTYTYRVSAVNAYGETLASAEVGVLTTNTARTCIVSWSAVTGATSYRIYGRIAGAETYMDTTTALSWQDPGLITPGTDATSQLPSTDTSATLAYLLIIDGTPGVPAPALTPTVVVGTGGGAPTFAAAGAVAAPSPTTSTGTGFGGTLANATFYYRVSTVTIGGVSIPCTEFSRATGASSSWVKITIPATAGAIAFAIYGRSTGAELWLTTVPANVGASTVWVDLGTLTPAGAMPVADTTDPSVTATGPNFFDTAINWSTGVVPGSGDTVLLENSSVPILFNINQSGVTLAAMIVRSSYTGQVGLPKLNPAGYTEHRTDYLKISVTALTYYGGSALFKLNVGSVACTANVSGTGQSADQFLPAFLFLGTSASNVLDITAGSMGVAVYDDETSNLTGGLKVGYQSNVSGDVTLLLGQGVTMVTVNANGGTVTSNSNITTLTVAPGAIWTANSGTIATLNDYGTVNYLGTGTIGGTAIVVGPAAVLDFTITNVGRTIGTTLSGYKGAVINDPNSSVTWSGSPSLNPVGCRPNDLVLNLGVGQHCTFT